MARVQYDLFDTNRANSSVKILVHCGAGNASQTLIFIPDRKVAWWLAERIIIKHLP